MNRETASRFLLLAWIALGFAAPASGQNADAHAEVVALLSTFDQALNEMDLDEVMSYYAEDIVILAPGEDAIVGWMRFGVGPKSPFATSFSSSTIGRSKRRSPVTSSSIEETQPAH